MVLIFQQDLSILGGATGAGGLCVLNGGCWRAWGEREWGRGWGGGWGGKDTEVEVIHLFCLAQATIGVYVVFLRLLFAAGRSHSRDRRVTPFSFAVSPSFGVIFDSRREPAAQ